MVVVVWSVQVPLTEADRLKNVIRTSIGDETALFLVKLFVSLREDVRVVRICLEVHVVVTLGQPGEVRPDRSDLPHTTDHLGQVGEPGVAGADPTAGPLVAHVQVLQTPPPVLDLLQEPELPGLPQPGEVSLAVVVANLSDLVK